MFELKDAVKCLVRGGRTWEPFIELIEATFRVLSSG